MKLSSSLASAAALWGTAFAVLSQGAEGHFFWAETSAATDKVEVTFSEQAGVPDPVIAMMQDKVSSMGYYTTTDGAVDAVVALAMNDNKTVLEGDLPLNTPAVVSGELDFGPFEKFSDLYYSFGAHKCSNSGDGDYEGFFLPWLANTQKPAIALRNCGGSDGDKPMSYQFDVGGFSPEGPLGVCLYRKGGLEIGCGTWEEEDDNDPGQHQQPMATALGRTQRSLRGSGEGRRSLRLHAERGSGDDDEAAAAAPYVLYAIANKTTTDPDSGDVGIAFASTSVYFQGPCSSREE